MRELKPLISAMRPRQWVKNLLVFVGPFFGQRFHEPRQAFESVCAFFLFCAVASGIYLVNDLADIEKDRRHPEKRDRALPSGRLRPRTAAVAAAVLCLLGVASGFWLSVELGVVLLVYLAMTLAYSKWLKHIIIVDLLVLTAGFLLRAAAGTAVAGVEMSDWFEWHALRPAESRPPPQPSPRAERECVLPPRSRGD